ncbi:SIS domain-containing protein [Phycicoccus sp. 3266]|uniref:SIS domain-containing protein n=1 Tax=Phycicoccus sp. 3266 TaxID=2817751 RepID=UPI002863643E|nr:SIS domain-containing protein [Phycicoccus sp. 3266]MDR6863645.1 fructoselysine-6-P-deglycase FrlB-like protein [Phycicoccus sp. 3266]
MRFPDGITAQPDTLARSAKTVTDALPDLPPPAPRDVTALVGIGASEHAARSAAPVWRHQGLRAYAVSASELLTGDSGHADVYVALSESGRSAETVAAMTHVTGATRIGVTNEPQSPLAELVEHVLPLDSGPDSPVYTTGYTATLQALGLLGDAWSGHAGDWSALPDQAATVLAAAEPVVAAVHDAFETARSIDVIGSGAAWASAGEGALMLRESARVLTATHETYNYLHGPMEPLEGQTACLVVGDGREVRLARDTSALGCPTLLITTQHDVPAQANLTVLTLPQTPSPLALAVLQILPIQLMGWAMAETRGLAVDGFRHHQDDIKLS